MPDNPQIAKWQRTLDKTFPSGVVCSWDKESGGSLTVYVVPRAEVTGMAGLDPVVRLPVDDAIRVLGPWRVTSYAAQADGNYRVTFDNIPESMLWSPHIPPRMAAELAGQRADLIRQAPRGGQAVLEAPDG